MKKAFGLPLQKSLGKIIPRQKHYILHGSVTEVDVVRSMNDFYLRIYERLYLKILSRSATADYIYVCHSFARSATNNYLEATKCWTIKNFAFLYRII